MRRNLDEIVNQKFSKKRTEKSKYFTEIFFEKYPMKYRELFEEYEKIFFKDNIKKEIIF